MTSRPETASTTTTSAPRATDTPDGSARRPRVAYVCADPGVPVHGTKGASVHVQEIVRQLRSRGADVEIFCARTGSCCPEDLADVPVHLLPSAGSRDVATREAELIAADPTTAAQLRAHGPWDLVYERYSLWSVATARAAVAHGWPHVLEVNAPLVDEQATHRGLTRRAEAEAVLREVAGSADAVVCVSGPVQGWVRAHAPQAATVVVPNGVDTQRVTPRVTPRAGSAVTIGFVGTLKPWHGVDVLLDAFAGLVGRSGPDSPELRLLLVGDGPEAAALTDRAAALGVAEQVLSTGAVDPVDVPAWLRAMDVGVAPYPASADTYFSPLKVFEYLAAGLPVVASAVGQLPDLLRHGHDGLLVPAGDAAALADALGALVADPAGREAMGERARERAVTHHSWSQVLDRSLTRAGLDPRRLTGRGTR